MIGEKEMKRIFSDRNAFRRTVNLAAVQVEGLSDDELSTALSYEVEPYSMIPAAEAEVAWKEIDGGDIAVKSFDVAIVRKQKKRGSIGEGLEKYLKAFVVLAIVLVMALAVDYVLLKRLCAAHRFRAKSTNSPSVATLHSPRPPACARSVKKQSDRRMNAKDCVARIHDSSRLWLDWAARWLLNL